jgi:hypothetical protein
MAAAHDTSVVNASGTYNNSGSIHDETRFSCGDSSSYCCPAPKNITRLTAVKTAARLYWAAERH